MPSPSPARQIEITCGHPPQASATLPVRSSVAEEYSRPSEVTAIACVSVTETAAEKLVALTRRAAMELAGLSRDPAPTLVQHIYRLHVTCGHLDPAAVAALARDIAAAGAEASRNQYPPYTAPPAALCCDGGSAVTAFARRARLTSHVLPAPGHAKAGGTGAAPQQRERLPSPSQGLDAALLRGATKNLPAT